MTGLTLNIPKLESTEIDDIWNGMPGGHDGFCKDWGFQQFAKEVERVVLVRVARAVESVPEQEKSDDAPRIK